MPDDAGRLAKHFGRHRVPWLMALCAVAFILTYRAPVDASLSDPWGTLLTAQAIVEDGTIRLDRYVRDERYLYDPIEPADNGHSYDYFPLGTSLAAVPAVALARLRGENMIYPEDNRELQNVLSSITVVVCALLVFAICRRFLPAAASLAWTAAFVFGSTMASTLGSALWSSNLALVLGLGCVLVLVSSERRGIDWRVELALGALLFAAYLCRPTMVWLFVVTAFYLAFRNRRFPLTLTLTVATLFGLFVVLSSREYGQLLPPYYQPSRLGESRFWVALAGNVLSPSRGVLIGSPFLLLTLTGVLVWLRRLAREKLVWLGAGWIVLHWLTISGFHHWWGGWSFGNRLFTEALPAFLLLSVLVARTAREALPGRARRLAGAAFLATAAFAAFVHSHQGLYNVYSILWCEGIDRDESRIFDWRHPQFLASADSLGVHEREHELLARPPYRLGEPILPTSESAIFEGFSLPEGGGAWRWSSSRDPSILFKVDEPLPVAEAYVLVIEAGTYQPQQIQVSLNGTHLGVLSSDRNWDPAVYRFAVAPETLKRARRSRQPARIFEFDLEIPGAVLVGDDEGSRRWLGLCLRRLELSSSDTGTG
ncbi:MAG: hypothetical protein GY719_18420 [bacterium]|nr:hypothetical protein [bacterium]